MPNRKFPGRDGLTKEFYERSWDDRDKTFAKNWQPILLLKVDTKILSQSFAEQLKHVLPKLIFSNQTAYVKNRCISESSRLISNVIGMCNIPNIPGYLVTMDIEKAFDSLVHDFQLIVFKNLVWVKISHIG